MALFEPIFEALNRTGTRYVIVGGVAVVLQGYTRLTVDLDLVVDLEPDAAGMGFADPVVRRGWIEQKGLQVFSFLDPNNPLLAVDLFVEPPLPFEELWACLSGRGGSVSIEKAGSPQDWGGRFEDAWKRQIIAGLSVSPAERLRWLEEAIRFADKAGALAQRRL